MFEPKNSIRLILGYEKKVFSIENWKLFFANFLIGFNLIECSGAYEGSLEDSLVLESIVWSIEDILNIVKVGNLFRVLENQDSIIVELTLGGIVSYMFLENETQYNQMLDYVRSLELS